MLAVIAESGYVLMQSQQDLQMDQMWGVNKRRFWGLNNCKNSVCSNGVEEIQGATLEGSRVRGDEQLTLGHIRLEIPPDIQVEMLSRE